MGRQKILSELHLSPNLSQLFSPRDGLPPRLVIVGVGQPMRGDDGAGVAVALELQNILGQSQSLLIINGGHAPENCLGPISRFQPDIILFIDAVRGFGSPGAVYWLTSSEAEESGGSTHTISLKLLGDYLELETGAKSSILGIQPYDLAFGEGLSAPVADSVNQLIELIAYHWRSAVAACSAINEGAVSVVNT